MVKKGGTKSLHYGALWGRIITGKEPSSDIAERNFTERESIGETQPVAEWDVVRERDEAENL